MVKVIVQETALVNNIVVIMMPLTGADLEQFDEVCDSTKGSFKQSLKEQEEENKAQENKAQEKKRANRIRKSNADK